MAELINYPRKNEGNVNSRDIIQNFPDIIPEFLPAVNLREREVEGTWGNSGSARMCTCFGRLAMSFRRFAEFVTRTSLCLNGAPSDRSRHSGAHRDQKIWNPTCVRWGRPTRLTTNCLRASVNSPDAGKCRLPIGSGVVDICDHQTIACALRTRPPVRASVDKNVPRTAPGKPSACPEQRLPVAFTPQFAMTWQPT